MGMEYTDGAWKAAKSILVFVQSKMNENLKGDTLKVLMEVEQKAKEIMTNAEGDRSDLI